MNNQRAAGAVVAILGLLLTCCACPLALDNVIVIGSNQRNSLYGMLFSGSGNAGLYLSTVQLVCVTLLALIVLVVGIVLVARSGRRAADYPG